MNAITDRLDEVLVAVGTRSVIATESSTPTLHLLSSKTMSSDDAPRIRLFQDSIREELDISLKVVGGGFGCTRIIITAESDDPDEAKRLLAELFSNLTATQLLLAAGFESIYRDMPYAHKTLATGEIQGEISNSGLFAFISYAREDDEYRSQLAKHLSFMVEQKMLRVWQDRSLLAGDEWKPEIIDALNAAQLILILVSADYMSSTACRDFELPHALNLHRQGKSKAIPIIVRPADWEESSLGVFQALPTNGMPISRWEDRDSAWKDVTTNLRRLVREVRQNQKAPKSG